MVPSKQFAQFIALMELMDTLAARPATESLTLRSATGEVVGRITVENGMIRFGVEHRGRPFVDELFMREQPRLSAVLRKVLDRHSLARTERDLTWDIPASVRASLCELTARALRRVASDCVLPALPLRTMDLSLPQLRLLNASFTPMEVALAGGLWGGIRIDDPIVQFYQAPSVPTVERWLLEWQPNDPGYPWPIQVEQSSLRRLSEVKLFGALAHLLTSQGSTRRMRAERTGGTASLAIFDEAICVINSNLRYLALLVYDRTQLARVLTAFEDLISQDGLRKIEGVPSHPPTKLSALGPLVSGTGPRAGLPPSSPAHSAPAGSAQAAAPSAPVRPGMQPLPEPLAGSAKAPLPAPVVVSPLKSPQRPSAQAVVVPPPPVPNELPSEWLDSSDDLVQAQGWTEVLGLVSGKGTPVSPSLPPDVFPNQTPARPPPRTDAETKVFVGVVSPSDHSITQEIRPLWLDAEAPRSVGVRRPHSSSLPPSPLGDRSIGEASPAGASVVDPLSTVLLATEVSVASGPTPPSVVTSPMPASASDETPVPPPEESSPQDSELVRPLPETITGTVSVSSPLLVSPAVAASEVVLDAPSPVAADLVRSSPDAPPGEDAFRTQASTFPLDPLTPSEEPLLLAPVLSPPSAALDLPASADHLQPLPLAESADPIEQVLSASPSPRADAPPSISAEADRPPALHRKRSDEPLLVLSGCTARVEGRTILKDLSLQLAARGVYAVMGPGGSGKSSLLGILGGRNVQASGWSLEGTALFDGQPLDRAVGVVCLPQTLVRPTSTLRAYFFEPEQRTDVSIRDVADRLARVRLDRLVEHIAGPTNIHQLALNDGECWRLAIARALLSEPLLLAIDEPTVGLSAIEAALLIDVLKAEGLSRTIVFVTHNQQHARVISHRTLLIAGGRLQENESTELFFTAPSTRAGQDYVRTGGCYVPSPDAPADSLADEFQPLVPTEEDAPTLPVPVDLVATLPLVVPVPVPQPALVEPAPLDPVPPAPAPAPAAPASAPPAPPEPEPEPASPAVPVDVSAAHDPAPLLAPPAPIESPATPAEGAPLLVSPVTPLSGALWEIPGGSTKPMLRLREFALRVGTRDILHDVSLDLADRGLYVLHVPNTIDRRMFVRALCGPRPVNFSVQGQASYDKKPVDDSHCPTTVQAGAQLLMLTVVGYIGSGFAEQTLSRAEQRVATTKLLRQAGYPEMLQRLDHDMTSLDAAERRVLEILRAGLQAAKVLVLEEPLAGLPMDQQARIVQVLRRQGQERALLILLQDGAPTEGLTDRVGWLIEGRTSPRPPSAQPPPAPVPDVPVPAGQTPLPEPSPAPSPAPAEPVPAPLPNDNPAVRVVGRGPRGFQWLRVGQLAGMPAPGLAHDLAYDLHLIANAGISHLITLTHDAISEKDLSPHGLMGIFFPIVDMDVPTEENTGKLCARVDELIKKGGAVGFHCKAGLGRTGTMLACQLIWEGKPAKQALTLCRSIEPGWIQSEKQLLFLEKFEGWLRTHRQK